MLSACYYSILITYSTALLFPRYSPLAPLPAHAKIPPRLLERHLTQRSRSEAAPSSRAPARAAVLPSALPARIWVQRGHHPSAGPSPSAAHTPCTASGAPAIHDQGRRTPRRTRAPGAAFVFVSLWLKEKRLLPDPPFCSQALDARAPCRHSDGVLGVECFAYSNEGTGILYIYNTNNYGISKIYAGGVQRTIAGRAKLQNHLLPLASLQLRKR